MRKELVELEESLSKIKKHLESDTLQFEEKLHKDHDFS